MPLGAFQRQGDQGLPEVQGRVNPSIGQWVAKRPSITDKRGRHYSQLFSHYVDPASILHQFRTTNNRTDFYNLKVGIAYVDAQNRLSVQEVLALCGSEGIASEDPGPCFMGVDQGSDLHVVIGKRARHKAAKTVHMDVYKDWEELDRLMRNFHVSRCVVDALPETRNARAFARRHKGKVYLNFYNEHQRGFLCMGRSQSHGAVQPDREPRCEPQGDIRPGSYPSKGMRDCEDFRGASAQHGQEAREDKDTGSKRYVYVKLGPDHFRHAFNYEAMARQTSPVFVFPNL